MLFINFITLNDIYKYEYFSFNLKLKNTMSYYALSESDENSINHWKFISAEKRRTAQGMKRIETYKLNGTKKRRVHIEHKTSASTIHFWDCCRFKGSYPQHVCKYPHEET